MYGNWMARERGYLQVARSEEHAVGRWMRLPNDWGADCYSIAVMPTIPVTVAIPAARPAPTIIAISVPASVVVTIAEAKPANTPTVVEPAAAVLDVLRNRRHPLSG